jgi:hypothetical protein
MIFNRIPRRLPKDIRLLDSYSESNYAANVGVHGGSGPSRVGEVIPMNSARFITSVKFYLLRRGSPTGNIWAEIYDQITGTVGTNAKPSVAVGETLAVSNTIDITTVSNVSHELVEFTFPNPRKVTTGAMGLFVVYEDGSGGTDIVSGDDTSSPTHPGNYSQYSDGASAWSAASTDETIFYAYGY